MEAAMMRGCQAGVGHATHGGLDGLPHRYTLRSRGQRTRELKTKEVGIELRPGDVIHVRSGGGGDWGNPSDRSTDARRRGLQDGSFPVLRTRIVRTAVTIHLAARDSPLSDARIPLRVRPWMAARAFRRRCSASGTLRI